MFKFPNILFDYIKTFFKRFNIRPYPAIIALDSQAKAAIPSVVTPSIIIPNLAGELSYPESSFDAIKNFAVANDGKTHNRAEFYGLMQGILAGTAGITLYTNAMNKKICRGSDTSTWISLQLTSQTTATVGSTLSYEWNTSDGKKYTLYQYRDY